MNIKLHIVDLNIILLTSSANTQWVDKNRDINEIATKYVFCFIQAIRFISGMHKKSIEAAKKMQEEDGILTDSETDGKDRCDRKSDSIAALRAKAQEHNAKMIEALNKNGDQSFDESSSGSFNNSFRSDS